MSEPNSGRPASTRVTSTAAALDVAAPARAQRIGQPRGVGGDDEHLEPGDAVVVAPDDDRPAVRRSASSLVAVERQQPECPSRLARRRATDSSIAARLRAVDAEVPQLGAGVAHLDVLAEDEVREPLAHAVGRRLGKVDQDAVAELGHAHVRQHAPLRVSSAA